MAKQAGRYTEGRFYMAWAAVALLLASWAGVAVHDQIGKSQQTDTTGGSSTTTRSTTTRSGRVTAQPQVDTRTRGS